MYVAGRVTVAIPTLNRSEMLMRAVRSALEQTYGDVEVIVSDDASTDDTLQRLSEITDARMRVFRREKRLGLAGNFDFCLRQATGEFFLLLGNDDILTPRAIELLAAAFSNPPGSASAESVSVVWCPCQIGDAQGKPLWRTQSGPQTEPAAALLSELWAGRRGPRFSGILLRTEDAIRVGGYEERYGDLCDIGNWGRVALLRDVAVCVDAPLVQYTQHHGSATSRSNAATWREWARAVLADMIEISRQRGDRAAEKLLRAHGADFMSGVTLTIVIQTIGSPGWVRGVAREVLRAPGAFLRPYLFRRLLQDGWKLLRLSG